MEKEDDTLDTRLPDDSVSVQEMNAYGYDYDGMLPLGKERALELFDEDGISVYLLYEDNTEGMAEERIDIEKHTGLFGVEVADWQKYLEYDEYFNNVYVSEEEKIRIKTFSQNPALNPSELLSAGPTNVRSNLFVDMDGTLARFHDENTYIERMYEPRFFANLKPFENAVQAVKDIISTGKYDVYILSSVISQGCAEEKGEWLDRYLPEIDEAHRIMTPMGMPKYDALTSVEKTDVLWDDYNKNLDEWTESGGTAVKCWNNINHKGLVGELWNGKVVSNHALSGREIADELRNIIDAANVEARLSESADIVQTPTVETTTMTMC